MKLISVVSERLSFHDIFIKYTYSFNIFVRYIHKIYTYNIFVKGMFRYMSQLNIENVRF